MAKTLHADYETARQRKSVKPVHTAKFFAVKKYGDGTDYAHSRYWATSAIQAPSGTPIYGCMKRPKGNTQTISPELGESSNGMLELYFQDSAGVFLKYLSNVALTLNGAHNNSVTTITVNQSTTPYPDVGTIKITTAGVVERVRYTGKGANTFTGCTRGVDGTSAASHNNGDTVENGEQIAAGCRVQVSSGYDDLDESKFMKVLKGEMIDWQLQPDMVTYVIQVGDIMRTIRRSVFLTASNDVPFKRTANPITFVLEVLTSTGAGTNGAYDVLAVENGAQTAQTLVDITGLEALRTAEFNTESWPFVFSTKMDVQGFFQEMCRALNCYPFITEDGKLSMKRRKLNVGSPSSDLLTLNESNIISLQVAGAASRIINVWIFNYDYGVAGAKASYGRQVVYTQQASVDQFGRRAPLVINSHGLKESAGAGAIIADRALQAAKYCAQPGKVIQAAVFYSKHPLEPGDQVKLTHSKIPNMKAGARGLTDQIFEVFNTTVDWARGRVILDLLWIGGLPAVTAPTTPGAVATPGVQEPVDFVDTTLEFGSEAAGFALVNNMVFGAGTPRTTYREAIPIGLFAYTIQSGDVIAYDIGLDADSVDTRGGLDLGVVERSNTAASATATTLVLDAGASGVDDFYNNMYIEITGSSGAPTAVGQIRQVTDYVQSTKTCTVATWTVTPSGTITFKIRRFLRYEGINDNENSLGMTPATQLGSRALGQWYRRTAPVPAAWVGKVLDVAGTGMETFGAAGLGKLLIANARILSSVGAIRTSLMAGAFSTQEAWAFGTQTNVSSSAVGLDTQGQLVMTGGIGLLAIGRVARYANTTGFTSPSATETVRATLTNFIFLASTKDVVVFHLKARVAVTNTIAASTLTLILRLRRGTTVGGEEITRLNVTVDNTAKGSNPNTARLTVVNFEIDVEAATALPAPGFQTYVLTDDFDETGSGGGSGSITDIKILAFSKSR